MCLTSSSTGASLVVQWPRLHTPSAEDLGSIRGQGTGPHAAAKTPCSQIIKNEERNKQKFQITLKKKKEEQQYRRWGFRMLAASWAKGLLPVTVNIGKSSSTWKQAIFKAVGTRWWTLGSQVDSPACRHKESSQEAEHRWRIFQGGIKNPDLTPRGKLSHLQKLTDRLSDFHTAQNG